MGATQRNHRSRTMSTMNNSAADQQADIEIQAEDEYTYPEAFAQVPGDGSIESRRQQAHDDLLAYLKARLSSDSNRSMRTQRYARIDQMISTWQKLSQEDTKRAQKQESTGKAQALPMNMPLAHTHIDDMTAFFTEVYYPSTGAYGSAEAIPDAQKSMTQVVEKMNNDAADTQYYVSLSRAIRSLLKYNVGGFILRWEAVEHDSSSDAAEAPTRNNAQPIDMYNALWDPSVKDVKDIRRKAEWAATVTVENRMEIIRRTQAGDYAGTMCALKSQDDVLAGGNSYGNYYKYPPAETNIDSKDGETANGSTVDWVAYGATLGEGRTEIKGGYEVVKMYCWLNPAQFGLSWQQLTYESDGYYLWEFHILAGERIVYAQPVNEASDALKDQTALVIPWYIGYLNYDDMLSASRSIAELLGPFQSFTSFLMNAHVQGARASIWGIKAYDSTMFDLSSLEANDGVAGYVASKMPGRDVRTGLQEIKGTYDGSKTMDQVGAMMQLVSQFFPAQSMPSQIAQMDRAVQSQVAAVLQGVSRRLQLLVKTADQMIFNPLRFDQYRKLIQEQKVTVTNVTDGQARKILGSGLAQLNQEILEQAVRQMMMSIMQNQNLVQQYDMSILFDFWASLLKIPVDSTKFQLRQNPNPPMPPGGAPQPEPPTVDPATAAAGIAGAA